MRVNDDAGLRRLLKECRTIAVVGLSPRPDRPSHDVARYLQAAGYTIIPVHPLAKEILGQTCYPTLEAIPVPVDMVNVFRRPEDVPPVAEAAVRIGARCLWLQLGIVSAEAERIASAAGLDVVMDRCLKIDHARLG